MTFIRQVLALILSCGILIATAPLDANALPQQQQQQSQPQGEDQQNANLTAKEIDNLVAPIALYPDALVAQILSGATYPDEIVEADRFVKANKGLSASDLATKVNAQSWDPSVKALTQFPSVLDNMSQNLSWTSALGEANYYQQKDVMDSIQRLRKEAKAAGNLKTTSQQTVVQQDPQTIVIQPANPQVVYVPAYNPTVVYGTPYYPPGYSTAALVTTGLISFGVGMAVGAAISNSWGWNSWGCGWHGGNVVYNRNVYVSRSNVYANGNRYRYNGGNYNGNRPVHYPANNNNINRSGNRNTNVSGNTVNINNGNRNNNTVNRGNNVGSNNNVNNANRQRPSTQPAYGTNRNGQNAANRPAQNGAANRPGQGGAATRPAPSADRGYGQKANTGAKTSAFGGYNSGGNTRAQSSRGQSSMGGGGGARCRPQPEAEPTDGSRLVGERIQPKRWNSRTEVDDVGSQQANDSYAEKLPDSRPDCSRLGHAGTADSGVRAGSKPEDLRDAAGCQQGAV